MKSFLGTCKRFARQYKVYLGNSKVLLGEQKKKTKKNCKSEHQVVWGNAKVLQEKAKALKYNFSSHPFFFLRHVPHTNIHF